MDILLLFLLCCVARVLSLEIQSKGRTGSKFDRLDCSCRSMGNVKLPIKIDQIKIVDSVFHCNIQMNATEDIHGPLSYYITIVKCVSKESLDTCETFYKFHSDIFCKMISGGWKGFYSEFKPEFKCPIKKGIYEAREAKFNLKGLPLVPVSGLNWKFYTNVTNPRTGENYACCIVETASKFN